MSPSDQKRSPDATPTLANQLVILSGKGGTGKTSVAAALAVLADRKVLADCDVDAANLHLLLDPATRRSERFFAGKKAHIDPERCSVCGVCAEHCRFDAIRLETGSDGRATYAVDPTACEGCGLCARVCEHGAVEMTEADRGEWFVSDTRHGTLVHARLRIGGENSGKLVTLVREQAAALAREENARLVVVDGPPGIGCPVIASVTGADLVLAVTEPTVSGAHDLERAIALVKGFDIPMTVCINKCDLNLNMAARIHQVCQTHGLKVVGELSYDKAVVQAQVEGKSIVEHDASPVAGQIRQMWGNLRTILGEAEE